LTAESFFYFLLIKKYITFVKRILNIILIMQTITLQYEKDLLGAYQKMFGERKENKYTENEIFIFNSKLNAAKSFAKYI